MWGQQAPSFAFGASLVHGDTDDDKRSPEDAAKLIEETLRQAYLLDAYLRSVRDAGGTLPREVVDRRNTARQHLIGDLIALAKEAPGSELTVPEGLFHSSVLQAMRQAGLKLIVVERGGLAPDKQLAIAPIVIAAIGVAIAVSLAGAGLGAGLYNRFSGTKNEIAAAYEFAQQAIEAGQPEVAKNALDQLRLSLAGQAAGKWALPITLILLGIGGFLAWRYVVPGVKKMLEAPGEA